ncbi:Asp-tRNA(Asn)/Glu-tRNA(Gln) amidotransferase subunit GatB [Patescibacteria group bacterium]
MKDLLGKYKLVLGLEIHLQPTAEKKMFCRCDANVWKAKPNSHTCPTCLGLPGALPVPNPEAIKKAQLLGLAMGCEISISSSFDRKHYFYPDLPKGYQISQYNQPLCIGGEKLERIHLEEDTAKSLHKGGKTLLDFNSSGIPLIEVVTKPCFTNIEEAVEFAKKVQKLVRDLGLGTVDMEKGQMRLEPNISLRTSEMEKKSELPSYKVEIKNINSFKFMEKAVKAEIHRQRRLLDADETPIQENRGFREGMEETISQRTKEHAQDYRYFPEPDIPPMVFDEKYMENLENEFEEIRGKMPDEQISNLLKNVEVDDKVKSKLNIENTKEILKLIERGANPKDAINVVLNKRDPESLFVKRISDESELIEVVKKVISEHKNVIDTYKSGKDSSLQFLIGQIMKQTQGKADASIAKTLLLKEIGE